MGHADFPRINEVVAYLDEHAPEIRDQLTAADAELAPILELGVQAGEGETPSEELLRPGLVARATVLAAALDSAITRSGPKLAMANAQLARSRRFRFVASALATIGASGVIGLVFLSSAATLIAGILTLGSNLASLFTSTVVLGSKDREAELTTITRQLVKVVAMAELSRAMLDSLRRVHFGIDEMSDLLRESNALFAEISDAFAALQN